jgi:hypothetical protein
MINVAYKIVEKQPDGSYKFLFYNRRKTFGFGNVLIAEKKWGYDGYNTDGSKKLYMTGIHVIETLELCLKYLKRFKRTDNKAIVFCEVEAVRRKPRSRYGVMLADSAVVLSEVFIPYEQK